MSDGYTGSLAEMVRSYLQDDDVDLLPDDPVAEVRRNTWGFHADTARVDVLEVVTALNFVAGSLRKRFADQGSGTFYAWYDEQAGQMRCSLSSRPPESLPFTAPYVATGDPVEVVRLVVVDRTPGLVPWSELMPEEAEDMPEEPPVPFLVWCAVLPR